jgi:ATP synthase proteolipid subunit
MIANAGRAGSLSRRPRSKKINSTAVALLIFIWICTHHHHDGSIARSRNLSRLGSCLVRLLLTSSLIVATISGRLCFFWWQFWLNIYFLLNKTSGYLGASACMILSSWGSAWGTWRAGLGVCHMGIDHPGGIMKGIIPVVMAGVLGIYGLIVAVILTQAVVAPSDNHNTYSSYNGYVHVRNVAMAWQLRLFFLLLFVSWFPLRALFLFLSFLSNRCFFLWPHHHHRAVVVFLYFLLLI